MAWITFLRKLDGTSYILRSSSQSHLKSLRSAECKKLTGKLLYVSPIIKDGKPFNFPIIVNSRRVKH